MDIKEHLLVNLRLPTGLEKIDRIIEGYQAYQVLLAALDLGLFEFLNVEGPSDGTKIAQGISINKTLTMDFLGTLVDIGFLSRHGERFANTQATSDFLLARSPFYQGDWVRNVRENSLWTNLSGSLHCKPPAMDHFNAGRTPSFIHARSQRVLRGELQSVTKIISKWNDFYRARSLLDIGGGHGLHAIALCQIHPHLKGVVFDKPPVNDTTTRYIKGYQMQKRLSAQAGDIFNDNLGTGYDIVLISHLLYKFQKKLESVFDKVCACLNPGGLLVTNHWFCPTGYETENSCVKELAKTFQSFGRPLGHTEDLDKLFQKKGFKILSKTAVPTTFGPSHLHLAVKESKRTRCSSQPLGGR